MLTKDEIDALMPKPYRASGQQMSYDGYDKAHCHLFSIGQVHSVVSDAIAAHTAKVLEDVEPVGYIHPEDIKNIAVSDVEHCEIYSKPFSWDGAVYLPLYPAHTVAALAARVAELEKDAGDEFTQGVNAAAKMLDKMADTPTPKPQGGLWTLTAPDGRTYQADSPLRCCSLEQRQRVPADVAMARIFRAASDPDDSELLDWLDATNKRFKMGWKVGVAPAGNCSVQSIICLGNSELVNIRAAIRAAIAQERKA